MAFLRKIEMISKSPCKFISLFELMQSFLKFDCIIKFIVVPSKLEGSIIKKGKFKHLF